MNKLKTLLAGTLAAATIFSFAGVSALAPAPAKAATMAELQAQVAALLAQLAALQGGSSTSCFVFTSDLTVGSTGGQVVELQKFLNRKGFTVAISGAGSAGMESTYFGALTQAALARYQASAGISPAAGYFGPITRARVNADCSVTPSPTPNPGGGTLNGGAGSVDEYSLISGLSNEEVGESEEDVEVAGLEIEVDDGSDIRLTAVRLVFDEGTADRRFDRYAEEVSLWLDGEEIARMDADEFTKSNNWTKTVSVDDSAIIRRGDTGELTVAVSGVRNLDSNDEGDTWTVDFRQIRFVDAQGASISEDPSTDTRTFSFESFAAAANAEMRLSLTDGEDGINEGRVIDIDDSSDTEDVEVLAFTIEARGDSDLMIDEIPVLLTSVGFNLNDGLTGVSLWYDGDRIATENVTTAGTTSTVVFEDLDVEVDAGDEAEFVVTVDVVGTDDAVDNGDTIQAEIGATERNAIDVEDESGEDLANNDRTGTATGEAHAFYDEGIMVDLISTDAKVVNVDGTDNDYGTFKLTIEVTAFDGDAYLDRSFAQSTSTSLTAGGDNRVAVLTSTGGVTTTTAMTIASVGSSSGVTELANTYRIAEGRTGKFEITLHAVNPDASVRGILYALEWGTADDATLSNVYTFNMGANGDYKTGFVFVND